MALDFFEPDVNYKDCDHSTDVHDDCEESSLEVRRGRHLSDVKGPAVYATLDPRHHPHQDERQWREASHERWEKVGFG